MVRGRYAPSPSGRMHLGNAFSALLSWLSVRSQDGEFLVRLEDIDTRCKSEYGELLLDDLHWMGLDWDGDVVVQSDRIAGYEAALEQLKEVARVYPCFCTRSELHAASAPHASDGTPIYQGTCRSLTADEVARRSTLRAPALRIQVPDELVQLVDGNMGAYGQNLARECGDFLLRRSDDVFAYQLVVVVDDAASGVTEVVRGSDLLSSAPRQMWLYWLLGIDTPKYFHHPMMLAPDGKRLSKREKSLDFSCLRQRYRPEELVGELACFAGILKKPEPCTPKDLIGLFSWDKVGCADIVLPQELCK